MLISLKHRFIFVANLKTASSSIEVCLRPHSEIAIPQTAYGKHLTFAQIEQRFAWVFDLIRREDFFVFGVIRDPVDYVLSVYNSHKKKEFIGFAHYTGGVRFPEFYTSWMARRSWQMDSQIQRFFDVRGKIALDYVLDYNALDEQWAKFCSVLGLPALKLGHYNLSPEGLDRDDLSDTMIDRIYEDFDDDYIFLQDCAGFLSAGDPRPGSWQAPSARKG